MKLETLSLFDGATEGYAIRINGETMFNYLNTGIEQGMNESIANFKNILHIGSLLHIAYNDGQTTPDTEVDHTVQTTDDLDEYLAWVEA